MIPKKENKDFAALYSALRKAEGRFYTDDEVNRLPLIYSAHPHCKEWKLRKQTADLLLKNLGQLKKGAGILEIGCGNGWLSAFLTKLPGAIVTGIDIHPEEIEQANRVFGKTPSLCYLPVSPFDPLLNTAHFDCIVLAASAQYFPSFDQLITRCMELLRPGGDIHIVDTHFYTPHEAEAARERTEAYYAGLGFPEMTGYYFQRTTNELEKYNYKIVSPPFSIAGFIMGRKKVFPYIIISKPR